MLLLQADHIEEKPIVNLNFLLDLPYSRVILINLEDYYSQHPILGKSEEQFPKDIVGQLLYTDVSQAGNSWAKLLPIFYKQCFDA